jgi:hypothetical protein
VLDSEINTETGSAKHNNMSRSGKPATMSENNVLLKEKQILSKMCQLRLEIRRCKKHNNLDSLKMPTKKRKNLNQQIIYATKTNGKTLIVKKSRKSKRSKH